MKTTLKLLALVWFLLPFGNEINAQYRLDDKSKKKYAKIKEKLRAKDYDKSLDDLDKFLLEHPDYLEGYLLLGNSLLDLELWDQAIEAYYIVLDLDPNYYDERLWYTLAYAYRQLQDYDNAIDNLEAVLSKLDEDSRMRPKIELEIEQVAFLKDAYNNPLPFDPIKLDSIINTPSHEYLPSFNADATEIVFTRRTDNEIENIYSAQIVGDSIKNPEIIGAINSPADEGAHCLSPSGKFLLFSRRDNRQSAANYDLYISTKKIGTWTKGQKMGSAFNTRSWDAQPSMSADGKSIYFASERPGGQGKKDLWVAKMNKTGKFSNAINLGDKINTKGNESAPFIHPDGQTLYFRSDTHPGMGGFDIFFSRKDENGEWSTPTNLGYPINTEGSEGALFVSLDGNTAYYASDQGNDPPQLDIFKFNMPEHAKPKPTTYLKAIVRDIDTQDPIKARLEIINIETGDASYYFSDDRGKLLTALAAGNTYSINIESKGYLFFSKNINLIDSKSADNPYLFTVDLERIPISMNTEVVESEAIILENIFFKSGSFELLESSNPEIAKLVKLLRNNPSTLIRIIGHTDNVGSEVENQQLSENRAKAVYLELVDAGIEEGRISYEGKGESQPIEDNDTELGRQTNRRTEFVIISN